MVIYICICNFDRAPGAPARARVLGRSAQRGGAGPHRLFFPIGKEDSEIMAKQKVCVLFGGVSSEHEVSLMSASSVIRNIPADRYEVIPVGITKKGRWLYYPGPVANLADGSWEQYPDCVPAFISPDATDRGIVKCVDGAFTLQKVDVVFPVLHGKGGEDGTVQGLLELAGIPYVGCGVLSSALCMDKAAANLVMDAAGIDRCEWDYMTRAELPGFDAVADRLERRLGWPIFVKPANAGSSVGISKAHDRRQLLDAVHLALAHDTRIVFERFVTGQEVECAVMGNDGPQGTLPGEILASQEFYTYDDKYIAGTSRVVIPAQLSPEKLEEVRATAVRAYRTLCCTGLARVDFFVEAGTGRVLLNEINTMPGFTDISMYPKLMLHAGMSYGGLLDRLIQLAFERKETPNG